MGMVLLWKFLALCLFINNACTVLSTTTTKLREKAIGKPDSRKAESPAPPLLCTAQARRQCYNRETPNSEVRDMKRFQNSIVKDAT